MFVSRDTIVSQNWMRISCYAITRSECLAFTERYADHSALAGRGFLLVFRYFQKKTILTLWDA